MEFRLFGAFEAMHDGCLVRIGRRLERCLLGVLLLEVGSPVSVDRLVSLLWDETPPGDPRATLHTYVSRIRVGLDSGGKGRRGIRLVCSGGGYRAEADPVAIDALRFRSLADRARDLPDQGERARVLREAMRLRRGPLLADVATAGVRRGLAAAWEEAWLTVREDAIEAELACGRHRELVVELTGLSAEYPFRERFTGLLMHALYRCGRAVDALAIYAQADRRMRAELAINPGADLRELHGRILRADPGLDVASLMVRAW